MGRVLGRFFLALLAGLSLLFAAIPAFFYRIVNEGVWVLLGLGLVCLLELWLLRGQPGREDAWEIFAGRGRLRRFLRRLPAVLLVLFFLGSSALSGLMVWKGWYNPPAPSTQPTAVVLGCLVKEGQPSKMLGNRLEAALRYLNEVPAARVVVTGGQGSMESETEAGVEARWLAQRGIAPERILVEDRSLDTYDNLANTAVLLREAGLPPEVVLFTDGFHQLRSQYYARVHGLTATGLPSPTPWGLLPDYWFREQLGICEAVLYYPGWIFAFVA